MCAPNAVLATGVIAAGTAAWCKELSVALWALQEFDGSDSGARPDEAVISWGKINAAARPVKLCADATLMLPLIIAHTFFKHWTRAQAGAGCS
jgi:deoxyhypusine synthase